MSQKRCLYQSNRDNLYGDLQLCLCQLTTVHFCMGAYKNNKNPPIYRRTGEPRPNFPLTLQGFQKKHFLYTLKTQTEVGNIRCGATLRSSTPIRKGQGQLRITLSISPQPRKIWPGYGPTCGYPCHQPIRQVPL